VVICEQGYMYDQVCMMTPFLLPQWKWCHHLVWLMLYC